MSDDPMSGVSARALAASEGLADGAAGRAEEAVGEALAPLASGERAFESRTREATRARASQARRTVGGAGAAIAERGRRMIDEGLDRLPEPDRALRQGRSVVRDQPATALIVAGAVGFGIGWLIHRREG